ncbi:hypothetical protein QLQ12_30640 [Actinoplanes sp. NEAU-A12]|uniref:Sulfotransferase family protein n=1 Tax=Actinoplanes sandaracinus TaxID=3045177 RepID=A0ABT6WTJ9_9ACTN|nr:hypothetical protein [Actinoplanes sandaracinus]MDI6102981.1 hypothetical protein [Actinoplanes sandaracinus]
MQANTEAFPVIALWSAPRARSTAFFRTMLERDDVVALHEPFCNIADYGETTVDGTPVHSGPELIDAIRSLAGRSAVFFKDTTDHRYPAVLADPQFLREVRHTFLIRRPAEIAASYYALRPEMEVGDIGIEGMVELVEAVERAGGRPPVIIDADDLVRDPQGIFAAYCAAVGIPFRAETLTWQAGTRTEWQRTERWHAAVSSSSGLSAVTTRYADTVKNNPRLAAISAHHEPFYRRLRERRLTTA